MSESLQTAAPSPWVCRFAPLIPPASDVLDLACGHGRHSRLLAGLGHRVEAVDRDPQALESLRGLAGINTRWIDLEDGDWPYGDGVFAGIVVSNYLFRPRLDRLLAALADPGLLIYETFARGNERHGRPSNPHFLLQPQESIDWVRQRDWRLVAFEEGYIEQPRPAVVQRLCAARGQLRVCL
ncbi:MAG: class I SAM-dependent methyltransferase [Candidatus Accumulibacter sp.]|nr:class I SAM-dependent methyltransferase [Accumulibacter sp.]